MKCMVGESLYVEAKYMLIESGREGLKKIPYKEPPQLIKHKAEKRLTLQKPVFKLKQPVIQPQVTEDFVAKI